MDGLTLTRRLKTEPVTMSIPVVAVTAHAMPEHQQEAFRAGCSAFITKPFRFRTLIDEISHVLQSSTASG